MATRARYEAWLRELVSLRTRIEIAEEDCEVPAKLPSKLSNLVTYAAEEAARELQIAREPTIEPLPQDSPGRGGEPDA